MMFKKEEPWGFDGLRWNPTTRSEGGNPELVLGAARVTVGTWKLVRAGPNYHLPGRSHM